MAGDRVHCISIAGGRPSLTYGAACYGISNTELLRLRRTLSRTMKPTARGRSLDALHLIKGDPMDTQAHAPILAWSSECWRASCAAGGIGCRLTLADLSRAWDACVPDRPLTWRQVRGPMGALLLSLERLSWRATGPFAWKDDLGYSVQLTSMSPALIKMKVRGAHYRWLERGLARKLEMEDEDGVPVERCSLDHVRWLLRTNKLNPWQKGCLASLATGAYWTNSRLHQAGYDCAPECPFGCGAPDSVQHRLCCCPGTSATRAQLASKRLQTVIKGEV